METARTPTQYPSTDQPPRDRGAALLALEKPLVVFVMNAGALDIAEIKASGVPIVAAGPSSAKCLLLLQGIALPPF